MNQKEFKALDQEFFKKLGEELDKKNSGFKIVSQNPFGELQIGVFHKESPDFLELFSYYNTGDEAGYDFIGHVQTKEQS